MAPPKTPRPTVVVTEHLADAALARLTAWVHAAGGQVLRCPLDDPLLAERLQIAHALVIRTYTKVTPDFLTRAPLLRVVGRAGVGLDNVDVPACRARGVAVVSTPDANTQAVVEYTFRCLMESLRPLVLVTSGTNPSEWKALRDASRTAALWKGASGRQLDELTVGIYGMGRIGQALARALAGFGPRVLYHDLIEIPPHARSGAHPVSRDELLRSSDILSIHVDGRLDNRDLLTHSALALLKPTVLLINASRGHVVNARALADFLRAAPDALAWVDVHDPEPFGSDYPLLGLPNARLTPHLGSRTSTAESRMSDVVDDVIAVLDGRTPRHPAW